MSEGDVSARLALPMLQPGQAQKEVTHNEALIRLDMLVQGCVVAVGLDVPPDAPGNGACWIVGGAPTGSWTGQAGSIAGWTAGGWRFIAAAEGMTLWNAAEGVPVRRAGGAWVKGEVAASRVLVGGLQVVGPRQPGIAAPAGGEGIDPAARGTINAILAVLRTHGLIGS